MGNGFANINNQERKIRAGWVNVNGVMRKLKNGFVNINGVMKKLFTDYVPFFYLRYGTGNLRKLDWDLIEEASVPISGQVTIKALLDPEYNQWIVPFMSSNITSGQMVTRVNSELEVLKTISFPAQNINTGSAICIDRSGNLLTMGDYQNYVAMNEVGGARNGLYLLVSGFADDYRQMICDRNNNLFVAIRSDNETYTEVRRYRGEGHQTMNSTKSSNTTGLRSQLWNTRITANTTHVFVVNATTYSTYGGRGLRISKYTTTLGLVGHYHIPIPDIYGDGSLVNFDITNDADNIYIAIDYNNTASSKKNLVIAVDYDGNEVWRHELPTNHPIGVEASKDGHVYYVTNFRADNSSGTIYKVKKSGEVVGTRNLPLNNLEQLVIDPPYATFPETW